MENIVGTRKIEPGFPGLPAGEWTELAQVRTDVVPVLEALLESAMEGDAAGIQAGRTEDGELAFVHHWMVVEGVK